MRGDDSAPPIVRQVARALRADVLRHAEGDLIGSEEDLLRRYGVSRPTLRQAAGLLSQEQLLRVKRGVGGGYIAARPSADAVAHVTAIYLQTRNTTAEEIIRSSEPISVEMARLAAHSHDAAATAALRAFVEQERRLDLDAQSREFSKVGYREFLRTQREFGRLLGALSENRVLELFLEVVYTFAAGMRGEGDVYINRPERIAQYRALRLRMAEAILERDEEIVLVTARRSAAMVTQWFTDDFGGTGRKPSLNELVSWQPQEDDQGDQPIGRAKAPEGRAAREIAG